MELVPPVGWADVVTKRDLDALEERMSMRFDAKLDSLGGSLQIELERGLRGIEREMRQQLYWMFGFMMTTFVVTVGLLQLG